MHCGCKLLSKSYKESTCKLGCICTRKSVKCAVDNLSFSEMFFFTVLGGLVILLICLHVSFPYFVHDCQFIFKFFAIRLKNRKYIKKNYTILDCFLDRVKNQPQKPFIVFEGKSYSYLDLDKQSNKAARALQTHGNLREGDTAALFLGNEPYFVSVWLGLAKIGCAAALLNYNIRSKSLLHCFSCCEAKVLIAAAGKQTSFF